MRKLSLATLTGVLLVAACNSAKKPGNVNFTKAIDKYLQVMDRLALGSGRHFR